MSRQKLIFVLVAVLCLPAATLAWLGVRLLDLDNALEAQRQTESREQAANRAVQVLSAMSKEGSVSTPAERHRHIDRCLAGWAFDRRSGRCQR